MIYVILRDDKVAGTIDLVVYPESQRRCFESVQEDLCADIRVASMRNMTSRDGLRETHTLVINSTCSVESLKIVSSYACVIRAVFS